MSTITAGKQTLDQRQIREKLSENGMYLQFIDNPTVNDCMIAIKENYMAFQYVSKEMQTVEICRLALSRNVTLVKYIKRFDNPDIFDLCMKMLPNNMLRQLFGEYLTDPTEEMCCRLVERDPTAIKVLCDDKKTAKVCDIVIGKIKEDSDLAPELLPEMNLTDNQIRFVIGLDQSYVKYLGRGGRYKIMTLFDTLNKDTVVVIPKDNYELKSIESYATNKIDGMPANKNMCVYYENVKDGKAFLVKDSNNILNEIHKYIYTRYGNKNLEYIKRCGSTGMTYKDVEADATFSEGIFYQRADNGKYEVYRKSMIVENEGWLFGSKKTSRPVIEKIRVYSLIQI